MRNMFCQYCNEPIDDEPIDVAPRALRERVCGGCLVQLDALECAVLSGFCAIEKTLPMVNRDPQTIARACCTLANAVMLERGLRGAPKKAEGSENA